MQAFMKTVGADLAHLNAFPGACIHKTGGHPILIGTLRDRYDGNAAGERFQDSVIARGIQSPMFAPAHAVEERTSQESVFPEDLHT